MYVPSAVDYARTNTNAIDLLDVWNDPVRFPNAYGLVPVPASEHTARRARFPRAPVGGDDARLTRLRNVDPDDLEILGQRDGITVARWTAGPAGGLDIDFDYRFAPDITAIERAMIERVGKEWAYRLDDTYDGPYTAPVPWGAPRVVPLESAQPLHGKDLTVAVFTWDRELSTGFDGLWEHVDGAYQPRVIFYGVGADSRRGDDWSRHVAAHEIGHGLGIDIVLRGIGYEVMPAGIEAYTDTIAGTFNGPNAIRENGGNPVPYQWLNANRYPVPPNTPGAEIDYVHPGPCRMIMSYCSDGKTTPDDLDFAFLADIGFSVRPGSVRDKPETYGYAAWGEWAAWGVGAARLLRDTRDELFASADAFGWTPDMLLAENKALRGNVTWTGNLLGVDVARGAGFAAVVGVAALNVDLQTLAGQARFDNLRVSRRSGVDTVTAPFRHPSLNYGIDVQGNAFADTAGHVRGGFFGPAHEQMAGTVDDRTPGVELLAAFGGKR